MFHELLILLSSYSSHQLVSIFDSSPWIHPSERILVHSLCKLARQHSFLRQNKRISLELKKSWINIVYMGICEICEPFMKLILEIEEQILSKDSILVGGKDNISLSQIEIMFKPWYRRMDYLEHIVLQIKENCKEEEIMNELEEDMKAGYKDIENIARFLLCLMQKSWVNRMIPWMFWGKIPLNEEFYISVIKEKDLEEYRYDMKKVPKFVSEKAAYDIFTNGKAICKMENVLRDEFFEHSVISDNMNLILTLEYPISLCLFENVIKKIKENCSKSIFKNIISINMITNLIRLLCDYYLIQYSEFAFYFLKEVFNKQKVIKMSKQTQISIILIRTFKELSRFEENLNLDDNIPNRRMLSLLISKDSVHNTSFSDLLIGVPIILSFSIPWPLTLFFSEKDVEKYSDIFSYLIAIKQARTLLSDLWRERRVVANPDRIKRSYWATANYVLYFLDGLWAYFQANVILTEYEKLMSCFSDDFSYDPESIQICHQQFLFSLTKKLFLKNDNFLATLKKILLSVNLIASVINSCFVNNYTVPQQFDENLIRGFIKQIIRIIEEIEHTDVDLRLVNHLLLRMEF
ncbi:hypothetical protein PNEG_02947 [Pneumocystis murina B123]|uniref:Spindle pole body component n=1 Tax=Pneumocystis murina (strain B123) TaxID=1069680 RepID=M7NNH1_PNEMU|nr:hypothetical protein PNEG_02947 [Pneumocystis murina B123]EMR08777.1 hypothetical protein PNEG_02947 [Pneumocystis murina B123]